MAHLDWLRNSRDGLLANNAVTSSFWNIIAEKWPQDSFHEENASSTANAIPSQGDSPSLIDLVLYLYQ